MGGILQQVSPQPVAPVLPGIEPPARDTAAHAAWRRTLERGTVARCFETLETLLPHDRVDEVLTYVKRLAYIQQQHSSGWKYTMLSHEHLPKAVALIRSPKVERPDQVLHAFTLLLARVTDRGLVDIHYTELAEQMKCHATKASAAMKTLADLGILRRRYHKQQIRYYLNSHVGWHGNLEERKRHAKQEKQLSLAVA